MDANNTEEKFLAAVEIIKHLPKKGNAKNLFSLIVIVVTSVYLLRELITK